MLLKNGLLNSLFWPETLSVETDHGSGDITGVLACVSLRFTDACPSVRLGLGGS